MFILAIFCSIEETSPLFVYVHCTIAPNSLCMSLLVQVCVIISYFSVCAILFLIGFPNYVSHILFIVDDQ